MTNITIIVPVHEFNDNFKPYLTKALNSVKTQIDVIELPKVLVVYTDAAERGGILDFVSSYSSATGTTLTLTTIKNEGKSDFQTQINFAATNTDTEYFSILEFDDEFCPIYFKNVAKHINSFKDVSLFLPITIETDDKSGGAVQIVNHSIWSKAIAGENGVMGYLNAKALSEFSFYTIGGGVFKKSDFFSVGGLKSNIKLSFTYEFLLRFIGNGNKIYTIAKFGYKHVMNRQGSLFQGYLASMPMNERKFWFETAKKESHFVNDRVIDTSSITPKVEQVAQ